MKSDPLFAIRNLRFAYTEPEVVSIDSLDINSGEITVFLGENGSGKTTLLKILNGLLTPREGEVLYNGNKAEEEHLRRLRRESVLVQQDPYLFSGSVFQNTAYGLKIRKVPKDRITRQVHEKLSLLDLQGFEHRKAVRLSGGEKQRIALARALVLEPKVLFLDEPTANIDPASVSIIEAILRRFTAGSGTAVMSTHNLDFAYRICDRLLIMTKGVTRPNPENIFRGRICRQDDHFSYFSAGEKELRCPAVNGEFSTAVLPYDDVILAVEEISSSAQNQFKGKILHIEETGRGVLVTIECGFQITSIITEYSVQHLEIKPGKDVYINFKSSAIKLY